MTSRQKAPANRVIGFISGMGLATVLILLLMLLTWLATLEQVAFGLFPTLRKYFDFRELWVFPDAGAFNEDWVGRRLPPLPGGYWVCVLLLVNMTLGGLIRLRKRWRNIGVLLAHFGILFMIVAGGVAQWKEERGVMVLKEGETADWARSLIDPAIEIFEFVDGEPTGEVHVIRSQYFDDLKGERRRKVDLEGLPFAIELQGYQANARPVSAKSRAPAQGQPVVDGFFLLGLPSETQTERDLPGCYARIVADGTPGGPFILAVASYQPMTVEAGGRRFGIQMVKQTWPVPFEVTLDSTHAEYYPNTRRPKSFVSDIVRREDDNEVEVRIQMNEPMRHAGMTFFQRDFNEGGMGAGAKFSGFEVVRNPSDKWPEYSLWIAGFGLGLHFIIKLAGFLGTGRGKK